jgi:Protein of unknown function (DUF2867)
MIKSYRFWCFFAAFLSLSTAALHVIGGGPEFHQPALESALSQNWKAAFSTIWHEVTAMLMLNGLALIFAGLALRKNQLALGLIMSLNVAFAALFFGYGVARLGTPFALPQWTLFLAISACVFAAFRCKDNLHDIEEAATKPEFFTTLPAASFADTYVVHGTKFDAAIDAARGAFGNAPGWISALMQVRNAIVAPFGLVHEPPAPNPKAIGMFPIISDTKNKVVLGLDDKHLDFRVVVELFNAGQSVSLTTLVKPHHIFGKAYLAIIMPFHRIIAATILAQAAKT